MKKDIYFYWGNETMSYMRYMTLYSFRIFNPDWKIYLIQNSTPTNRVMHTVEKQDKTEYSGPDYSNYLENLNIDIMDFKPSMIDLDDSIVNNMSDVHIKDILNWKLLSEFGGVVADMDILFTKPIFGQINEDIDIGLVCFDGYPEEGYIPVTLMYSAGANIFFEKTYRNSLTGYNPHSYESCGNLCMEERTLDDVRLNFPGLVVQKLNNEIIFPFIDYPYHEAIAKLHTAVHTEEMAGRAIGIHWYGGNPVSQANNYKINERSVHKINNTLTMATRGVLCQNLNNQK